MAQAAKHLLALTHGEANALVLRYRAALIRSGLAPATINRRLAALRSLVQLARLLGLVPWHLSVPGVEAIPYRDTRGPGKEGYQRLLAVLEGTESAKAHRDHAIIRLLFDLALRREESCAWTGTMLISKVNGSRFSGRNVPRRNGSACRNRPLLRWWIGSTCAGKGLGPCSSP